MSDQRDAAQPTDDDARQASSLAAERASIASQGASDYVRRVFEDTTSKARSMLGHKDRIFCCRCHVYFFSGEDVDQESEGFVLVATGSEDKTVRLWRGSLGSRKFKLLHELQAHQEECLSVEWSPDGCTLASCGADNKVVFWSIDPAQIGSVVPAITCTLRHRDHVYRAIFAPVGLAGLEEKVDGEDLVVTCCGNQILFWSTAAAAGAGGDSGQGEGDNEGQLLFSKTLDLRGKAFGGVRNPDKLVDIFDIAVAEDRVAAACSDGTVRVLKFSRVQVVEHVIGLFQSPVTCLRFMSDVTQSLVGNDLVVCCKDGGSHLVDVERSLMAERPATRRSWWAHQESVYACTPVPGTSKLMTCSRDCAVKLWDMGLDVGEAETEEVGSAPHLLGCFNKKDYPFHSADFAIVPTSEGGGITLGGALLVAAGGQSGMFGTPWFYFWAGKV